MELRVRIEAAGERVEGEFKILIGIAEEEFDGLHEAAGEDANGLALRVGEVLGVVAMDEELRTGGKFDAANELPGFIHEITAAFLKGDDLLAAVGGGAADGGAAGDGPTSWL